jgi:hypothetical protein
MSNKKFETCLSCATKRMHVTYKSWVQLLSRAAGTEWVRGMVMDTKMLSVGRQPSERPSSDQQSPNVFAVVAPSSLPVAAAAAVVVETVVVRIAAHQ